MSLFLIVLKASCVMGAAAMVSALGYRRSSASFRHLVWTLAVAGLLVLPVLSAGLPGWQVAMPAALAPGAAMVIPAPDISESAASTTATAGAAEVMANPAAEPPASRAEVLPGVYLAVVFLLLLRLVHERWLVHRLARRAVDVEDPEWTRLLSECAREMGVRTRVRLLRSLERSMPMAFGTRTPSILIPALADTWTGDRRRAVLLHELAHIVRHDCLTQLMASVACAIYWVHPGVWWVARRLRVERELACDDQVLNAGARARDYAEHLLELAYALGDSRAPALVVSMARRGQVEGRMLAVLDAARNRAVPAWRGRLAAAAMAAALLVPLAGVRGVVVSAKGGNAEAVAAPRAGGQDAERVTVPGREVAGTWEIRATQAPAVVNLRLSESANSSHGSTVALDRFQGLAPSLLSSGGPATFSLRRAAGTLAFEGMFRPGAGAGTYTFAPSATFPAELVARGFARPTAAEQYLLAREDVAFAFIDELAAQHYARPDLHQLVNAAQHGVELDYLREMSGLGYRFAQLDALIRLRDHGVSPQYIRELGAQGLTRLTADDLVRARDHGVSPQYVGDLKAFGYGSLSLDDLVGARDHGVSPEYVRDLRQLGYQLTLAELTAARDHGVSPEYVRDLAALGYPRMSLDELIAARDHGVSPEYVRDLQDLGYRLTLGELTTARDHGISPEYVRQAKAQGREGLSLGELVTLRQQGVGYRQTRLMFYVHYHVQAFHRWVKEFADQWSK
jgi:beta-lactamase regulating signal transducer with metallopeptidase domain